MKKWRDKTEFKARVYEWANKLDVKVQAIALRPMSDKWASCSTAGRLNFNSELLSYDRDVADYVIVHELLHFSVPNHGKLWKSLMRAHLGDYESLDKRLKQGSADAYEELGATAYSPTIR
jgi:predicted metal-dependent hydrolase